MPVKRYAIVIEDAGTNLAAYVPDLPGCVATGESKQEVERLIREAIAAAPGGNGRGRPDDPRAVELRRVR